MLNDTGAIPCSVIIYEASSSVSAQCKSKSLPPEAATNSLLLQICKDVDTCYLLNAIRQIVFSGDLVTSVAVSSKNRFLIGNTLQREKPIKVKSRRDSL